MSEWTHTLDGVRCYLEPHKATSLTQMGLVELYYAPNHTYGVIPLATWERAIPIPQPIVRTIEWLPIEDPMRWRAPEDCWVVGRGIDTPAAIVQGSPCHLACTHYALIEGTLP